MSISFTSRLVVVLALLGLVAGCANTIRGIGQDTANAVDATQGAGNRVDRAARY